MDEATARAMVQARFDASNVSVAGGGRGDDIARASEIYADDAVVEWPQGGERLRGKANVIAFRSTYLRPPGGPPGSSDSSRRRGRVWHAIGSPESRRARQHA